jgi:hypothetical protein
MTEEEWRLLSRLGKTQDGKDLIALFKRMAVDNYKFLLASERNMRDELIGFGCCLKEIINLFENCDKKLITQGITEGQDRT